MLSGVLHQENLRYRIDSNRQGISHPGKVLATCIFMSGLALLRDRCRVRWPTFVDGDQYASVWACGMSSASCSAVTSCRRGNVFFVGRSVRAHFVCVELLCARFRAVSLLGLATSMVGSPQICWVKVLEIITVKLRGKAFELGMGWCRLLDRRAADSI